MKDQSAPATKPRVLIVDDQPINIQLLYKALSDSCELFVATGGIQAIEICRRELPDLILLDIEMPDLNGMEVCRRLKRDEDMQQIPVLFVTGHSTPEKETEGLEAGAVDFIAKPIHPAVVRARIGTHLTLKRQADQLRIMALVDGLTGVANRRRFDEIYSREWRICTRSGEALGLIMIDVDFFKKFNDHYGHQAGDACLTTVAHLLKSRFRRPRDLVARFGGEEFVCLAPGTMLPTLQDMAEGVRASIELSAIPHAGSECARVVTVSAGIAVVFPSVDQTMDRLIRDADVKLYAAKESGRNCVR